MLVAASRSCHGPGPHTGREIIAGGVRWRIGEQTSAHWFPNHRVEVYALAPVDPTVRAFRDSAGRVRHVERTGPATLEASWDSDAHPRWRVALDPVYCDDGAWEATGDFAE